jgi:DDE superfamily endonuclease
MRARVGQKNTVPRRWARKGSRPTAPKDQRTASAYIFGAICPEKGKDAGLVLPRCATPAMNAHLAEISRAVDPGAHAVQILDGAGWHVAADLVVFTLLTLPSHAPELNPVENVWQFLRENWLGDRIFDSYEDILDQCCEAWNKLVAQPWMIMSLGLREWAYRL